LNTLLADLFPAVAIFCVGVAFTLFSLWAAGRIAPWFLQQSFEPPTIRSYFFDAGAEMELTPQRATIALIALAMCLALILAPILVARTAGLLA